MTNSDLIRALGRWSHDPRFSERAQKALRRAAISMIILDAPLDDYARNGDLQNHTTWSDGSASPRAVVRAAENLGYEYVAITDHSAGLRFARGMPVEKIRRQHAALEKLSARLGFRIFRGVEVNVLPSGDLDMNANDLSGVELVVASCHSYLRRTEDQTARLIAAVTHPRVHILGHPRGRIFGVPRGIRANWDEVFAAAAQHGTRSRSTRRRTGRTSTSSWRLERGGRGAGSCSGRTVIPSGR